MNQRCRDLGFVGAILSSVTKYGLGSDWSRPRNHFQGGYGVAEGRTYESGCWSGPDRLFAGAGPDTTGPRAISRPLSAKTVGAVAPNCCRISTRPRSGPEDFCGVSNSWNGYALGKPVRNRAVSRPARDSGSLSDTGRYRGNRRTNRRVRPERLYRRIAESTGTYARSDC